MKNESLRKIIVDNKNYRQKRIGKVVFRPIFQIRTRFTKHIILKIQSTINLV